MKVSKKNILLAYAKLKKIAYKSYKNKEYNKCFNHISVASTFAYSYNFIFKDDELELLLKSLSEDILKSDMKYVPQNKVYVMLDGFGRPNRGLTQQYLRAFANMENIQVYYFSVYPDSFKEQVYKEIESFHNIELVKVQGDDLMSKLFFLSSKLLEIKPSKIFTHIAPWDVAVPILLYSINSKVERYNINLTDHAFWLGTGCFDYTLEFREYGCSLSLLKRGFKQNQILLNSFYPIITDTLFEGFPEEARGKIIFFSGGSLYKIYGKNNQFLEMMKHILEIVPNSIILYAGDGDRKPVLRFIKNNNLEKKFLLLGTRKDINQVFAHCDIYLDTYPFSGGLMRQYAAYNAKPIMAFSEKKVYEGETEDVFYHISDVPAAIVYSSLTDYYCEILRLVKDSEYRKNKGLDLKQMMVTPESFTLRLSNLIENKEIGWSQILSIDEEAIFNQYIDNNNIQYNTIGLLLFKRYNLFTFLYFPSFAFKYFPMLLSFIIRKILLKKLL